MDGRTDDRTMDGSFDSRFNEEMQFDCKHDPKIIANWQTQVAAGLEHQKPVVTEALIASLNKADLG
jgi:hypothetical protein